MIYPVSCNITNIGPGNKLVIRKFDFFWGKSVGVQSKSVLVESVTELWIGYGGYIGTRYLI